MKKIMRNCDRDCSREELEKMFIDWYNKDVTDEWFKIDIRSLKHNEDGILHEYIDWLFAPIDE